jgi:ATP-dependent Lon protease
MKKNVIISRDLVPLPNGNILIEVGRTKSVNVALSILDPKTEDKKIIVATQKVSEVENPELADIYPIASICEVVNVERDNNYSTEVYKILIKPIKRVLITQLDVSGVICLATYESIHEEEPKEETKIGEMFAKVFEMAKTNLDASDMDDIKASIGPSNKTGKLADVIADKLTNKDPIKNKGIRVEVLQELNVVKRISTILKFFKNSKESEKNSGQKKIDEIIDKKVNENLSKQQKEFYLREKMRAIKDEIGKINPNESDVSSFRKRVEENPYPSYIKTKVLSELNKLESSPFSQENAVTRTYIE